MATSDSTTPLDVFVHSNPALSALVLYWTTRGYSAEAPATSGGLLFPWAILALGMVGSSEYRSRLPKTTNARMTLFFTENPEFRGAVPSLLAAWRDPFWSGLRYGVSKGMLSANGLYLSPLKARLKARTGIAAELEKAGTRFGRLVAREGSDDRLASVLGTGFTA